MKLPRYHLKGCNMKTSVTWLVDCFSDKKIAIHHQEKLGNEFPENEYWVIDIENNGGKVNAQS